MKLSEKECENRFFFILELVKKGYDIKSMEILLQEYEKQILEDRETERTFNFSLNFMRLQSKVFNASERLAKYYRNYRLSKSITIQ